MIYDEFAKNSKFKEEILKLIKFLITDRKFSDKDYLEFSKYLLEEFVASYSGVNHGLDYYGLLIYHQESSLHHFIGKIQQGEIFQEINKKLSKEKLATVIIS